MKFIIAPDKFKGSLNGFEFCDAVQQGLRMALTNAEVVKMPLADGGDGTIDIVDHYLKGEKITLPVNDPFFRTVRAAYLYSAKRRIAFIEMAEASGLKLLKESEKDCFNATTFGTGELIADALARGAKEIILGIGGSATNDGGMGMAYALGFRFLDQDKRELKPIGANLRAVEHIDGSKRHPKIGQVTFKVACDVTNPFYGANGAAKIYAAQKGASAEEIELLDTGLQNFSNVVDQIYGIDLQTIPGSGAAGGIGGGASVFLGGRLTSGIDLIKELADFDKALTNADWIITGEGKLDAQTLSGKTIAGVVASAKMKNIPVAALCGSVDVSVREQNELGLAYVTSIVQGISSLQEAMDASYDNLVRASFNFARLVK